jgi:hypothetical protein
MRRTLLVLATLALGSSGTALADHRAGGSSGHATAHYNGGGGSHVATHYNGGGTARYNGGGARVVEHARYNGGGTRVINNTRVYNNTRVVVDRRYVNHGDRLVWHGGAWDHSYYRGYYYDHGFYRPWVGIHYYNYYSRPSLMIETWDPRPGFYWVRGGWEWDGTEWIWFPGHYAAY